MGNRTKRVRGAELLTADTLRRLARVNYGENPVRLNPEAEPLIPAWPLWLGIGAFVVGVLGHTALSVRWDQQKEAARVKARGEDWDRAFEAEHARLQATGSEHPQQHLSLRAELLEEQEYDRKRKAWLATPEGIAWFKEEEEDREEQEWEEEETRQARAEEEKRYKEERAQEDKDNAYLALAEAVTPDQLEQADRLMYLAGNYDK